MIITLDAEKPLPKLGLLIFVPLGNLVIIVYFVEVLRC